MDDRLHHRAAGGHDLGEIGPAPVGIATPCRQFFHVVAGREHFAGRGNYHGAHFRVIVDIPQRGIKRRDQAFRQTVTSVRPVECENGDVAGLFAQQDRRLRNGATCCLARHRNIRQLTECNVRT